jgi:outer membrane immunogenic protein
VRKLLLRTVALVALMPLGATVRAADIIYAPPVVSPLLYWSWTGFYVGGNVGASWGTTTLTDGVTLASLSPSLSGFIGGAQLGFNYQFAYTVLGLEADIDWASLNNTSQPVCTSAACLQATASTPWISTIAVRLGFAADRMLMYAKGGGGWAENKGSINIVNGSTIFSGSNTTPGWLAGAGFEYAFTRNWTAKLEYDFLGLTAWEAPGTLPNDVVQVSRHIQMIKAGINYKFDWAGPFGPDY